MWSVVILHLLCIILVQVGFSIARGVDLVYIDPKSSMHLDTVAKTLNIIQNNLHTADDPEDVYNPNDF